MRKTGIFATLAVICAGPALAQEPAPPQTAPPQITPPKTTTDTKTAAADLTQSAEIRLYHGSGRNGWTELRLSADDRLVTSIGRLGRPLRVATRQLRSGAYDAALRYLTRHPIQADDLSVAIPCIDYGKDEISGGGYSYQATCPIDALTELSQELDQIISDHK